MSERQTAPLELVESVRERLTDGRAIATHDVRLLVEEIDRLRFLLNEMLWGNRHE